MKEKSMKKRKYLKDGEEESPVPKKQIKVTVGEMGGLTKRKKRKKEKDLSGDRASDTHHRKDVKKGKGNVEDACGKKKKEDQKLDLNDIYKADHTESVHRKIKKKKKKSSKNKDVCDIENAVVGFIEDDRVNKKKKRGKGTSGGVSCEDVSTSAGKSKKKKEHGTSDAENDGMVTSGPVGKKEKKKKQNKVKKSDTSVPSENVVSVGKKHKKDKGVGSAGHSDTEVIVPKKKKKKKIEEFDIGDMKKCEDAVYVGKKKKKDKHRVSDEVVSSEGAEMTEKSKEKDADVVVVVDNNDSDEVDTCSTDKVKKGKKRKQKDAGDIVGDVTNDIPLSKKKKKGKKDKSCDTETSVLGAKKKDKKKRELNEGEDDKNGHDTCGSPMSKKKTIEKIVDSGNSVVGNESEGQPDGGTCNSRPGINMGQWGTAAFDNKERQDKFYRLLGGFKKKTDSPVQNTAVTNSVKKPNPYVNPNSPFLRKNLALSSSDAKNLDDNLEKDFNRAMEWKLTMPRGTGIGYTPPPDANKLFYIDKTKSTSIKFD